jgi:hypothetical protein
MSASAICISPETLETKSAFARIDLISHNSEDRKVKSQNGMLEAIRSMVRGALLATVPSTSFTDMGAVGVTII